MSIAVLQVRGLGKRYRLYASPRERLMALLGWADRSQSHWALKDVSFELQRGQCLGVIGDNGAGKSTLLKLLAGTLHASHGTLQRKGRVTAILELGAGFHPDFTGRDNLMFGGSFIGLGQGEMLRLSDAIIAFSELGEAIDRPVKTYSSGMTVRLAFALVTAVQPELLIIDEALAVGDQHFQKKCVQRIQAFRQNGCTVLFCSHSLYHVRQLCDRVLWLDQGQVRGLGDTESVLAAYEAHVRAQNQSSALMGQQPDSVAAGSAVERTASTGAPDVVQVQGVQAQTASTVAPMSNLDNRAAALVSVQVDVLLPGTPARLQGPDLTVTITARTTGDDCPSLGMMIEQANGVGITSAGTHADGVQPRALGNGLWQAQVTFGALALHTGEYVLSVYLFDAAGLVVHEEWPDCVRFLHVYGQSTPGLVRLPHVWS